MVLSNHLGQRSKTINKSTKSVILLSYTDVENRLIFQKQSSVRKAVANLIPPTDPDVLFQDVSDKWLQPTSSSSSIKWNVQY